MRLGEKKRLGFALRRPGRFERWEDGVRRVKCEACGYTLPAADERYCLACWGEAQRKEQP